MPAIPRSRARWARSTRPCILVQTDARRRAAGPADPDAPVAYVTQTTLSVDDTRGVIAALEARVSRHRRARTSTTSAMRPRIANRAVRELAKVADVILVVGANNSSNSNRLREIGVEAGVPSYLIADGRRARRRLAARCRVGRRHRGRLGARGAGRATSSRRCGEMGPVERLRAAGHRREGRVQAAGGALAAGNGPTQRILKLRSQCCDEVKCRHPLLQKARVGAYVVRQHLARRQALSAGADAGAAVPLQSRLRRLRQDRLPRRDPQPALVASPNASRRSTNAARRSCRSPAASRCCTRRSTQIVDGHRRAAQVRLPVHQRAAAGKEDRSVQAEPVFRLVGPSRRRPRDARPLGLPRRRLRPRGRGDPRRPRRAASGSTSTARCSTTPSRSASRSSSTR